MARLNRDQSFIVDKFPCLHSSDLQIQKGILLKPAYVIKTYVSHVSHKVSFLWFALSAKPFQQPNPATTVISKATHSVFRLPWPRWQCGQEPWTRLMSPPAASLTIPT